jgi:exosortase
MTPSAVAAKAKPYSVPHVGWFAIAVVGLVWLELVSRLRLEWSINPQYGYGWTVPFLTAFIFWRRWQTAPNSARPRAKMFFIAAIIVSALLLIPIRLIEEANPDWRLMSWTMAAAVALITFGVLYLAGGIPWLRHFAFPILFFLVAVPWPTQFEQFIIQGLMRIDTAINVEVLNAIGIAAVQMGNVIEVGTGLVGIDEACTGVRSLQATFMVSLFLGELYDLSVGRRFVLVCVGALVAFVCNLARTFLLVFVGAKKGVNAIQEWHDPAGLSILFICLFVLWALSMLLRRNESRQSNISSRDSNVFPISRAVLFALLACVLAAEIGTQIWYRLHESPSSRLPAWSVKWPKQAPNFKSVAVAEQAQELLRYNEGGGGEWKASDGHQWGMYFFRWLPGRTAGLFIKNHRPDICLPASGMKQVGTEQRKLLTVNGVPLPIRSYVFENNGMSFHVFYCYWDGTVPNAATLNQENWTASGRLRAVREGRRDVGAQMLELITAGFEREESAEEAVRYQLENIIRPG